MAKVKTAAEPCTGCDQARIEKELEAEEAKRAFERDLEKVRLQNEHEFAKLDKEHANALETAQEAAATDRRKAGWQAEADLTKSFHEKIAEVAGGAIERSRDSAKFVQTAAAGIVTLYSGLLALVFSVTDNPLPIRGVYAAVFLGLAVALATGYLAFITKPDRLKIYNGGSSLAELQLNRTDFLSRWISRSVMARRWAIRTSVLSLAVGVAFIPAAFLTGSRPPPIPDAPVAPTIPTEIASTITKPAAALFEAQVDGYEAAVAARNKAVEEASTVIADTSERESDLNLVASIVAGVALLLVLVAPLIYGAIRDPED